MSDHQFGNQFMCSVVASHVSHLPTTNLSFLWIAPPAGTGCVNFMWVSIACVTNVGGKRYLSWRYTEWSVSCQEVWLQLKPLIVVLKEVKAGFQRSQFSVKILFCIFMCNTIFINEIPSGNNAGVRRRGVRCLIEGFIEDGCSNSVKSWVESEAGCSVFG